MERQIRDSTLLLSLALVPNDPDFLTMECAYARVKSLKSRMGRSRRVELSEDRSWLVLVKSPSYWLQRIPYKGYNDRDNFKERTYELQ